MQLALRPYATAGVALVGASVIAVSPVTVTPTAVQEVRDEAVHLSALVNPIDAFRPIFEAAVAEMQNLGRHIGDNPAPILSRSSKTSSTASATSAHGLAAQIGVIPQLPQLLGETVGTRACLINGLSRW